MKKRILFVTGTRADFGKLKPLINAVKHSEAFEYQIFGTGMHTMSKYGNTITEIYRSGFTNIFTFMNQVEGEDMEVILANTVIGLSRFLHEQSFDLIVVHGDRVEALAGATVGALRNIRVAHIEGGEISGTVDELMRHAISKLSHLHFVASEEAQRRLIQLGENSNSIFKIGSPNIDVMLSSDLPTLADTLTRYEIEFEKYAIAILHPVTTEQDKALLHAKTFIDSLIASKLNYIVVFPNNDIGSEIILNEINRLKDKKKFRVFPSLRFEFFLTLLKNCDFIIGNSSAGIHEAPIYGVPTVNLGTRQYKRYKYESIIDIPFEKERILEEIEQLVPTRRFPPSDHFGDGHSAHRFMNALQSDIWTIPNQKVFNEFEVRNV